MYAQIFRLHALEAGDWARFLLTEILLDFCHALGVFSCHWQIRLLGRVISPLNY